MIARNLSRALFVALLFTLAATIHAQEAPQVVRDKFLKEPVSISPTNAAEHKGFFRPFGPALWASTIAYAGSAIFDIGSSRGLIEQNPLSRGSDRRVNIGRAVLIDVAVYAPTLLLEKRHPHIAFWMRMIISGGRVVFGGVHNLRQ
jgi:hypothetical protein